MVAEQLDRSEESPGIKKVWGAAQGNTLAPAIRGEVTESIPALKKAGICSKAVKG